MDPRRPGVQYGTGVNAHQHDDDSVLEPSTTSDNARHTVQVAPNLDDLPEKRKVEYWAVIRLPNGSDVREVTAKVYRPDSKPEYQLSLQKVDCSNLEDRIATGSPIEAAFHSGQVTASEADSLVAGCRNKTKSAYSAVGDIGIDAPPGEYLVELGATDGLGATSVKSNSFDVLAIAGLKIDFDKVDFGVITPNTPKGITGDLAFTPTLDRRPTVKSVGNSPVRLSLKFDAMVGVNSGKTIDQFAAELSLEDRSDSGGQHNSAGNDVGNGPSPGYAEKIGPVASGVTATFKTTLDVRRLGQLQLTIHPGDIPADSYSGTLSIWGSR